MNSDIKEHDEHSTPHGLSSADRASFNDLLCFSDNGLLWWAAKSICGEYNSFTDSITFDGGIIYKQWNPLKNDGDAFKLFVALHLDIRFHWDGQDDQFSCVSVDTHGEAKPNSLFEEPIGWYVKDGQIDEAQSTRFAIVRAAAQVARART